MIQNPAESWRFATYKHGCWASYYEIWTLTDSRHERYRLDKAYLTLYKRVKDPDQEKQILCLHCDPYEPDDGNPSVEYKKRPHLHVEAAEAPIPKAHFSLTVGSLAEVLTSAGTLTDALESCVKMIKCEVLDRMEGV